LRWSLPMKTVKAWIVPTVLVTLLALPLVFGGA
jgi:hypothetical protein